MSIVVVDYAFTHPTIEQLKAAGIEAVGRYMGQAMTEPKNLSAAEAHDLSAAGIGIFTNFEYGAQQVLGGARQAQADVALFRAQRAQVGMPAARPCFAAADWDVPDFAPHLPNDPASAKPKLGPLWDYWNVWRTEEGLEVSAGYGGYWVIKRLFDARLIGWGFQTIAWSPRNKDGSVVYDPRAVLHQTGATEFGNAADVDVPERADFGQWKVGVAPPPRPVPPPQPGPTKAQAVVAARTVVAYLEAH